jgi:hypothetical protein
MVKIKRFGEFGKSTLRGVYDSRTGSPSYNSGVRQTRVSGNSGFGELK